MKFGKSILSPNYFREPHFDSLNSTKTRFKFICVNCQKNTYIEYTDVIGNEWNWEDKFSKEERNGIKQLFAINAVNKSPDGGWIALFKFMCKICQTHYLIYAGVNEYYNSLYKVTLQGITEIIES